MIDPGRKPVDVKTTAFSLLVQSGPPSAHGTAMTQVETLRRISEHHANGPATGCKGRF